jgi:hypothetical protein
MRPRRDSRGDGALLTVNGDQDPVAFIISANLKRRNLNRGQQAMLVALGLRKMRGAQTKASKESGIDQQRISRANFVIENAPEQIDLVLSGFPLEKAYEIAKQTRTRGTI